MLCLVGPKPAPRQAQNNYGGDCFEPSTKIDKEIDASAVEPGTEPARHGGGRGYGADYRRIDDNRRPLRSQAWRAVQRLRHLGQEGREGACREYQAGARCHSRRHCRAAEPGLAEDSYPWCGKSALHGRKAGRGRGHRRRAGLRAYWTRQHQHGRHRVDQGDQGRRLLPLR